MNDVWLWNISRFLFEIPQQIRVMDLCWSKCLNNPRFIDLIQHEEKWENETAKIMHDRANDDTRTTVQVDYHVSCLWVDYLIVYFLISYKLERQLIWYKLDLRSLFYAFIYLLKWDHVSHQGMDNPISATKRRKTISNPRDNIKGTRWQWQKKERRMISMSLHMISF